MKRVIPAQTLLYVSCSALLAVAVMAKKYTPDWDSLDARPLPAWYDDAKIGIFMHFGPYAVPGKNSQTRAKCA